MVCPVGYYGVRRRNVYLPKKNGWYDLYTNKYYKGGQTIDADAPYEKIRAIDETELRTIAERLRAGKIFAKTQIEAINRKLELISSANNSLEEKLDAINSELEVIEEYEDDIQALDRYATELDFIANMAYDNDIFVGIEVGDPTEKDIIDY